MLFFTMTYDRSDKLQYVLSIILVISNNSGEIYKGYEFDFQS